VPLPAWPGQQHGLGNNTAISFIMTMNISKGKAVAALVEIVGPDPKLAKARKAAFHTARAGITTLSTSGIAVLLRNSCGTHLCVLTTASAVELFTNALEQLLPATRSVGGQSKGFLRIPLAYQYCICAYLGKILVHAGSRLLVHLHGHDLPAVWLGNVSVPGLRDSLESLIKLSSVAGAQFAPVFRPCLVV
jgi:hypothetical protein